MRAAKPILLSSLLLASGIAAAASEEDGSLQEVVVTAQRRSENVQSVPIAITVIDARRLAETGARTATDLIPYVPGFTGNTVGAGTPEWAIRGISTTAFDVGSEPSVGVFIDDGYIGRNMTANTGFFDVERVEVLKGPQGTLFGRNAIAGAINIVTNKPQLADTTAQFMVGAGNLEQREATFAVNVPVSDRVALRASGMWSKYDGEQTNLSNGKKVNGSDEWAVRLGGLLRLNDTTDVILTVQHNDFDGLTFRGPNVAATGERFPDAFYNNVPDDPHETNRVDGVNLHVNSRISDQLAFASITDVRKDNYTFGQNADGTPDLSINFFQTDVGLRSISQEFRLSHTSESLDWLLGASFWREHAFSHNTRLTADGYTLTALGFIPPGTLPDDALLSDTIGGDAVSHSYAAYADGTWRFSPAWSLKAGLRLTRDEKDWASTTGVIDLGLLAPPIPGGRLTSRQSWSNVSPRLVLNYVPTEHVLLYGGITRGYKGGGFNTPTDGVRVIGFDPEHVTAYEIGFKSDLAGGSWRLNGAAFYNDYRDLQVLALVNSAIVTSNAATAKVTGGELETVWLTPLQGLELSGNYGLQDAKFRKGFLANIGDVSGNRLPVTPKSTYSLTARYRHPLSAGRAEISLSRNWRDTAYFEAGNRSDLSQGSYGVLNGRIRYEAMDERWELALIGENLTDKDYADLAQDPVGLGAVVIKARPRLVRLQFGMKF